MVVHSQLSGCSTARRSSTVLFPVAPAKVKALKSILSTEDPSDFEMKNTCLIQLSHFINLNMVVQESLFNYECTR